MTKYEWHINRLLPNTETNINVPLSDWVDIVRQIGANPFQVRTGRVLKIKLVYLGCLMQAYEDTGLLQELKDSRHAEPLAGKGKDIMSAYKNICRNRFHGDMSIAMDRARAENKSQRRV